MNNPRIRSLAFGLTAAVGLALSATQSQADLALEFSSAGQIKFTGNGGSTGTFEFTSTDDVWQWNTVDHTSLKGMIGSTGDKWTFNSIVTDGVNQTASVVGGGQLRIQPSGGGAELTGNVVWIQIASQAAGVNRNAMSGRIGLNVNVTDLSYPAGGGNSVLAALAAAENHSMILSFQSTSLGSLSELTAQGKTATTSYSGEISAAPVPEPTTVLAGALLLLPFALSAFRTLRKRNP